MKAFKTIVPWDMTQEDLTLMVSILTTSRNGGTHSVVLLGNGMDYKVSVDDINDYINELNVVQ